MGTYTCSCVMKNTKVSSIKVTLVTVRSITIIPLENVLLGLLLSAPQNTLTSQFWTSRRDDRETLFCARNNRGWGGRVDLLARNIYANERVGVELEMQTHSN